MGNNIALQGRQLAINVQKEVITSPCAKQANWHRLKHNHMAEAFEGLIGFRRVVDDVIIYDKDISSHVGHMKQFLQRCQESNIHKQRQVGILPDKVSSLDFSYPQMATALILPSQMHSQNFQLQQIVVISDPSSV